MKEVRKIWKREWENKWKNCITKKEIQELVNNKFEELSEKSNLTNKELQRMREESESNKRKWDNVFDLVNHKL